VQSPEDLHSGVLNLAAALENADGDSKLVARRAALLLKSWPRKRNVIQQALLGGDFETVQRQTHRVKSLLDRLGAKNALESIQSLQVSETAGLARAQQAARELRELDAALQRLEPALRNLTNSETQNSLTRECAS
jgi:HPt (histidine-containing phosphotransfer) domain-containing protein